MTKHQLGVIDYSIQNYGIEMQSTVCMEECAELIQAISKVKRYPSEAKYKENLVEEIADVSICIELLKKMYSVTQKDIDNWTHYKINRIKERMGFAVEEN